MLMLNTIDFSSLKILHSYLNTSHVNVKLLLDTLISKSLVNLNTSHVNVKLAHMN